MLYFYFICLLNVRRKNSAQISNWIYHSNTYQLPHLSLKIRTPITFQSYFNCIEMKQDWWSSFGELRIYLIFLLLTIYLYNKYLYYGNKGKYIQTMAHLHGGVTTFAQLQCLLFYILVTTKVISRWIPTCLWQCTPMATLQHCCPIEIQGGQHHNMTSHTVTLSWCCANRFLSYPVNDKWQAR